MEHIFVSGYKGMLGSYLLKVPGVVYADVDVTDLSAVLERCRKYQPTVIVHLAALTDLNVCEEEPDRAYRVNTVGTYHMALAAREIGAKLIYVSTSGVFDGSKREPYTEDDVPRPINVYGHSKYLGELAVRSMLQDFLILRTSWVFGGGVGHDKKFVGKIIAQLDEPTIQAVTDRYGSPTYAKDFIEGMMLLLTENKRGVYHLCNTGNPSRFAVAEKIVSLRGAAVKVLPAVSSDFMQKYISGENESMACTLLRSWQEALTEYVNQDWDAHIEKK